MPPNVKSKNGKNKSNFPAKEARVRRRSSESKSAASGRAVPKRFPIVGIGASAGGLEAFRDLLAHLPTDTGMGFVLVQHLDPEHESALPAILGRATTMPVHEVTNKLRVEPNNVYVIPPDKNLTIADGILNLRPRPARQVPFRSIDYFLESLAEDHREFAIGVILSGTATDGTLGLEALKAEGGITFAQDGSAKYDSMPRSAAAAGCVDFVLSPENIAAELARIAKHPLLTNADGARDTVLQIETTREQEQESRPGVALPSGGHGTPDTGARKARTEAGQAEPKLPGGQNDTFKKILMLVRNHAGVDFLLYKSNTIQRRITRRMVLNKHNTLEAYANFLKGNGKELDALYSDMLIAVTSFFRNPESFEILRHAVFPKLISVRSDQPVRVWVLGCSTGQEAYSVAMGFAEVADSIPRARKLQVFATDLNDAMLDKARAALYSKTLAQDVSPERLRRFFVEEEGGYRVSKELRQMVVFARQNLLSDPPFSHMDLISCRNLLIYIDPELQKKIIPTFHYALNPDGYLFLGASESVSGFGALFEPVDRKHKIFLKKPGRTAELHLLGRVVHPAERKVTSPMRLASSASGVILTELSAQREADRLTINQFAPPGVLINAEMQVLQFRGPTSAYLEPPTGKASFNVLKMARDGLMLPLRAAISKAKKDNKPVLRENVAINGDDKAHLINIEVIPLNNLRERNYLILFHDPKAVSVRGPTVNVTTRRAVAKPEVRFPQKRIAELERELSETRDYLQSIQEQYEAAHEELQAQSEEAQSANEELQSMNEELETSKEELESANEELTTVNEEMTNRNTELSSLNSDLKNLHVSINTPILVLGRDLTIRRFTPPAERIFNLLAADVGRPMSGIRHNLVEVSPGTSRYPLETLINKAIDTVSLQECEVRDKEGRWYELRIRPYLTAENKIDGAVLILTDIDLLKRTEEEIRTERDYANAILQEMPPLMILDHQLRIVTANEAFYRHFGVNPTETQDRLVYELGNGQWNNKALRTLLEEILPRQRVITDFEITHDFPGLGRRTVHAHARQLDSMQRILLRLDDVTERLHWQEEIRVSEQRYRRLFEAAQDGILILDPATRKITDANPFMTTLLAYSRKEMLGLELWQLGLMKDEQASQIAFHELQSGQVIRYDDLPLETKDGRTVAIECVANLYEEGEHKVIQCNIREITERKQAEEDLRQAHAQLSNQAAYLEQLVQERTVKLRETVGELEAFSYSLAHDLRAPLRAITNFAQVISDRYGASMDDAGKNLLVRIASAAARLDVLIKDVLSYTRILHLPVQAVTVDLDELTRDILGTYPAFHSSNVSIQIDGKLPHVLGHPGFLTQAVANLLSNAVKFVAPGIAPRVKIWAEERGSEALSPSDVTASAEDGEKNFQLVRIHFQDNGIGIAPEDHERVFRMFERINPVRDFEGTGIGLTIVRKAIERLGGRVGFESARNQGSTFWVELRMAKA